ncbi:MAG: hypothetical protein JOZ65_10355, partial [Chloroflexi bacterium]|nr:hypothetical protein [Chloroflexota bacterium]
MSGHFQPQRPGIFAEIRTTPVHDAIVEVHSHHMMRAYFSATDDRDETGRRVYGVLGRLAGPHPEIASASLAAAIRLWSDPFHFRRCSPLIWVSFEMSTTPLSRIDRQRPLVPLSVRRHMSARWHDRRTKRTFCSKS